MALKKEPRSFSTEAIAIDDSWTTSRKSSTRVVRDAVRARIGATLTPPASRAASVRQLPTCRHVASATETAGYRKSRSLPMVNPLIRSPLGAQFAAFAFAISGEISSSVASRVWRRVVGARNPSAAGEARKVPIKLNFGAQGRLRRAQAHRQASLINIFTSDHWSAGTDHSGNDAGNAEVATAASRDPRSGATTAARTPLKCTLIGFAAPQRCCDGWCRPRRRNGAPHLATLQQPPRSADCPPLPPPTAYAHSNEGRAAQRVRVAGPQPERGVAGADMRSCRCGRQRR